MTLQQFAVLSALTHLAPHRLHQARHAWLLEHGRMTAAALEPLWDAVTRLVGPTRMESATRLAERALERAAGARFEIILWGDTRYPVWLDHIADPPFVLWVRGRPAVLERPAVAIVGARAASPYALEVAGRLGAGVAAAGLVVVSGLARGVDAAAHRGALDAGGVTVAVLGSGLDVVYPPQHRTLADQVETDGAVVSEFLPGTPPRPDHFPRRNRIVSGLSRAVVVVEAAVDSGALITARCALDQGRDVMAVPGNVLSNRNRGAHALIKDGAKLIEGPDDILEELGLRTDSGRSGDAAAGIDDPVWRAMTDGDAQDLDAICAQVGQPGPWVLTRLLELELKGFVTRCAGGRFLRSRRMVVT